MSDSRSRIPDPHIGRRHVVILGAGASLAALPDGDKWGRRLPLMNNFIEVLGIGSLLDSRGIAHAGVNFEALYSQLVSEDKHPELVRTIEASVFSYFDGMLLPDYPTIYDHLVLSLRPKDFIATFNWDPFLLQAMERNYNALGTTPPRFCHLHGCVALSYCDRHKPLTVHRGGYPCGRCGQEMAATRLLFPVTHKDYNSDPHCVAGWRDTQAVLKQANLLTIFGYGAPNSDVEAIALLKQGWGDPNSRQFEETEIIDIREEDDLLATWEPFIHTHHYEIGRSFYDSLIARFTRRSCDAFWNMTMQCMPEDGLPVPRDLDFPALWDWYRPLIEAENEYAAKQAAKTDGA